MDEDREAPGPDEEASGPHDEVPGGDDARAELIAVDDAWSAALIANDADRMGEFMTDDWVLVAESGFSTKEEFLALVSSGDLTHSAMERVNEPRIRVYGDTGVISSRVTNTADHRGPSE